MATVVSDMPDPGSESVDIIVATSMDAPQPIAEIVTQEETVITSETIDASKLAGVHCVEITPEAEHENPPPESTVEEKSRGGEEEEEEGELTEQLIRQQLQDQQQQLPGQQLPELIPVQLVAKSEQ